MKRRTLCVLFAVLLAAFALSVSFHSANAGPYEDGLRDQLDRILRFKHQSRTGLILTLLDSYVRQELAVLEPTHGWDRDEHQLAPALIDT